MKINPDAWVHVLKIEPEYYQEIKKRNKKFEIRLNDRNYQDGDILRLRQFNSNTQSYIDSPDIIAVVTYILQDERFLQPGYICMSINVLQ